MEMQTQSQPPQDQCLYCSLPRSCLTKNCQVSHSRSVTSGPGSDPGCVTLARMGQHRDWPATLLHTCVWCGLTNRSALVWKDKQTRVGILCVIPDQTQRFRVKGVLVSSANEDDFPCGHHEIGQILPANVINIVIFPPCFYDVWWTMDVTHIIPTEHLWTIILNLLPQGLIFHYSVYFAV